MNNSPLSDSDLIAAMPNSWNPTAFGTAAMAKSYSTTYATSPTAYDGSDDDDDTTMPWERDGWVPLMKSGNKQKTPNMVRNELQRYIDQCKADGSATQTRIIEQMGINNNTFRRFMDPKTYKNTWSAASNGTYWAGAKLLARLDYEKELAKKTAKLTGKRKSSTTMDEAGVVTTTSTKKAKTGKQSKEEAEEFIRRINAVVMLNTNAVYDTCPEVVAKIKAFLLRDGVTKTMLCTALGNINSNSMGSFLGGKKQDQCGNVTYQSAYIFFEKLRILGGKAKSKARLKNEGRRKRVDEC